MADHIITNPKTFIDSNSIADLKAASLDIPPLSASSPSHSLVSWDSFVQDNAIPYEIFPSSALALHAETNEVKSISLFHCDTLPHPWSIVQDQDFSQMQFSEKQPHVCVSLPAQNSWSKNTSLPLPTIDALQSYLAAKSPLDTQNVVNVKTYSPHESLPLNEFIRVVGILEWNASECSGNDTVLGMAALHDLLPTIHVLYSTKLTHLDLIAGESAKEIGTSAEVTNGVDAVTDEFNTLAIDPISRSLSTPSNKPMSIESIRTTAISAISHSLGNDSIAAEYIFLQLFSKMYSYLTPAMIDPKAISSVISLSTSPKFQNQLLISSTLLSPYFFLSRTKWI